MQVTQLSKEVKTGTDDVSVGGYVRTQWRGAGRVVLVSETKKKERKKKPTETAGSRGPPADAPARSIHPAAGSARARRADACPRPCHNHPQGARTQRTAHLHALAGPYSNISRARPCEPAGGVGRLGRSRRP